MIFCRNFIDITINFENITENFEDFAKINTQNVFNQNIVTIRKGLVLTNVIKKNKSVS